MSEHKPQEQLKSVEYIHGPGGTLVLKTYQTNESKHTPGPWNAKLDTVVGFTIRGESPGYVCEYYPVAEDNIQQVQANARLIAASPDLLAACKKSLTLVAGIDRRMRKGSPWDNLCGILEAAIAKAETPA